MLRAEVAQGCASASFSGGPTMPTETEYSPSMRLLSMHQRIVRPVLRWRARAPPSFGRGPTVRADEDVHQSELPYPTLVHQLRYPCAGVLGAPPSFGGGATMRAPTQAAPPSQRIDPAQIPRPKGGDEPTNVRHVVPWLGLGSWAPQCRPRPAGIDELTVQRPW